MTVTVADVRRLIDSTPGWTRAARQFRMASSSAAELQRGLRWGFPIGPFASPTLLGYPVAYDDSVPHGTVHFEIPVPELPKGLV